MLSRLRLAYRLICMSKAVDAEQIDRVVRTTIAGEIRKHLANDARKLEAVSGETGSHCYLR